MLAKSFVEKKEDVQRKWLHIDAKNEVLGRVASQAAVLLKGKHKATYTPHVDGGDFVVITNAAQVKLTGQKLNQKTYYHHTGYRGGLKKIVAKDLLAENPVKMFELAVQGMLPKGPLGRQMLKKLKVYSESEHPHEAQQVQEYKKN